MNESMKSEQPRLRLVKLVDEKRQPSAEVLRKWAALGSLINKFAQPQPVNWEPVKGMIKAAEDKWSDDAEHLRELLKRSNDQLRPLDDPLNEDFGAHRWLSAEREEAYSDWLKWVLEQLKRPALIAQVLGIRSKDLSAVSGELKIVREFGITDDQGIPRRTDLDIYWGGNPGIRVEVKKHKAESVHPAQLEGQEKGKGFRRYILLVTSGTVQDYKGKFIVRYWNDVCIEIRRLVPTLGGGKDELIVLKAMLLAFVGAVEQNLLRLQGALRERIDHRHPVSPDLKTHLQAVLRRQYVRQT